MISCPEFDTKETFTNYELGMDILTVASLVIHPYVMLCIVYRSPLQLKHYRWYLLWHQFLSFIGDLLTNLLTRPIIFVPLPVGYCKGPIRRFIPALQVLALGELIIIASCAAALHLFVYRYCAVHKLRKFPWYCHLTVAIGYGTTFVTSTLTATADVDLGETFGKLRTEYSCVTPALINISNILAYDRWECITKTIIPVLMNTTFFCPIMTFLAYSSFKAINVKNTSEKLKRVQRKFFIQLICQTAIPFLLVIAPALLISLLVITDYFGFKYSSEVTFFCWAVFGMSGGIVLILMNPDYQFWRRRKVFTLKN